MFTLYFSAVNKFTPDYPSYTATSISTSINAGSSVSGGDSNADTGDGAESESLKIYPSETDDNDYIHIIVLNSICTLGFSLSVLWICMARASKYMYERLECGLDIAYHSDSGFLDEDLREAFYDEFAENLWAIGEYTYIPRHGSLPLSDYDYNPFSLSGGMFSSSKINIFIGHILGIVWSLLLFANPAIVGDVSLCTKDIRCILVVSSVAAILIFVFRCGIKVWKAFISGFKLAAILTIILALIIYYSVFCSYWVAAAVFMFLYIAIALFVSYRFMSDNKLHFTDYLLTVLQSLLSKYNPDENQVEWINKFFNPETQEDEQQKEIRTFVIEILSNYGEHCDDPLQRQILKQFIKGKVSKGAIRRLLSHEYLCNLFETALMYRKSFKPLFWGTWDDERHRARLLITQETFEFWLKGQYIVGFDIAHNGAFVETRLFADTSWGQIRQGKSYVLNDYDRTIHIIYKEINGKTAYITLSFGDSVSSRILSFENGTMDVDIKIKEKGDIDSSGKEFESSMKRYAFTVYRWTSDELW